MLLPQGRRYSHSGGTTPRPSKTVSCPRPPGGKRQSLALASRLPRSFLFLSCTVSLRVSSGFSTAEAPGSPPTAAATLGRWQVAGATLDTFYTCIFTITPRRRDQHLVPFAEL